MTEEPALAEIQKLLDKALPPYYETIGRIASVWAMFEQRLDHLIWDLTTVNHKLGACITSQLSGPAPRFRVVVTLLTLREWDSRVVKKVRSFSDKIRVQQEARNRSVHDALLVGADSETVYRRTVATINNRLVFEVIEHNLDDLRENFKKSNKLLQELEELLSEIRDNVPTLPRSKLENISRRQGPPSEASLSLGSLPQTHSDQLEAFLEGPGKELPSSDDD